MRILVLILMVLFSGMLSGQIHSIRDVKKNLIDSSGINNRNNIGNNESKEADNETMKYTPIEYSTPNGSVQFINYVNSSIYLTGIKRLSIRLESGQILLISSLKYTNQRIFYQQAEYMGFI